MAKALKDKNFKVGLMAHSNLDAIKLRGVTVHKLAGLPINDQQHGTDSTISNVAARLKSNQVFIIDAVHKLPESLLLVLSTALKRSTGLSVWFGGVPVILLLDSSSSQQLTSDLYGGLFSSSGGWYSASPVQYKLPRPLGISPDYRQFTEGLRDGQISTHNAEKLANDATDRVTETAVVLVHSTAAKRDYDLDKLGTITPAQAYTFSAQIVEHSELPQNSKIDDVVRVSGAMPTQLTIKVGARIQLLAPVGAVAKHTLATVVSVDPESHTVTVSTNNNRTETVQRVEQIVGMPSDDNPSPTAPFSKFEVRTLLPLRLGYAFTPEHAEGLPSREFHIRVAPREQNTHNFNHRAFVRPRQWAEVTWGFASSSFSTENAEELARHMGLEIIG